jgi:hypothetical protein
MNETCADCGERATCEYDWGMGPQKACASHDPLRWPYGATMVRLPSYYRSLPLFPVGVTAPVCTCPPVWGGLCPPPACPAHGQTEMYQVRC